MDGWSETIFFLSGLLDMWEGFGDGCCPKNPYSVVILNLLEVIEQSLTGFTLSMYVRLGPTQTCTSSPQRCGILTTAGWSGAMTEGMMIYIKDGSNL